MKNTMILSQKRAIFKNIGAFTLIEVIITLTILGLIFGSVMSVFLLYSTLGSKVEVNRLMQSNIKTIVDHIREDVNKNGINVDAYDFGVDGSSDLFGDVDYRLYIGENEYYLTQNYDWDNPPSAPIPISSVNNFDECSGNASGIVTDCTLIKKQVNEDGSIDNIPLSNSWVSFRNINFHVSKDFIPKVTMFFEMSMANNKGIRTDLIDGSSMNIQATVSERVTN